MADGVLQYIGARYVPTFYNNSDGTTEWRSGVAYEPLTIVSYNNNSYTSRKPVPAEIGNPSQNNEYWAQTGVYNAQIGQLQNDVSVLRNDVDQLQEDEEKKIFWYTPEMFGAVGDGTTDDTEAIQKMFNEVPARSKIVMFGDYLCTAPITIAKSELKISGGFVKSEYTPKWEFNIGSGHGACIYVTHPGLGISNINFSGQGNSAENEDILLEFDARNTEGNIDAIFDACGFYKARTGILSRGRNIAVYNSLFSTLNTGFEVNQVPGLVTEYRGFQLTGNRIHTVNVFVRSQISISDQYRAIVITNNYMDFVNTCFTGPAGGIFIKDNVFQRFLRNAAPFALISENVNDSLHYFDEIINNTVEGSDAANSRGLEIYTSNVIIKGNHFYRMPQSLCIGVYGNSKVIITDNVIDHCQNAITVRDTASGCVQRNTLYQAGAISATSCTVDTNLTLT